MSASISVRAYSLAGAEAMLQMVVTEQIPSVKRACAALSDPGKPGWDNGRAEKGCHLEKN